MRVVFANRFYRPDESATAQILTDLAEHLVSLNVDVTVVTSDLGYRSGRFTAGRESIAGVNVIRLPSIGFWRGSLVGRSLDYACFYLLALVVLISVLRRGSICVAKTDPPLISVVCAFACMLRGAKLVNWIQDLFPEVAERLGVRLPAPIYNLARHLRNWSFDRATLGVVVGARMKEEIARCTPNGVEIVEIPNWVVGDLGEIEHEQNGLRREWVPEGGFLAGYSGNLGRAHQWNALHKIALEVSDEPNLLIRVIGSGTGYEALRTIGNGELSNLAFSDFQPLEILSQSLSAIDVHIVLLEPSMEGSIVPSKFYGALAVGRPVLFIGSKTGELARIINDAECGWVFADGEIGAAADKLKFLNLNREEAQRCGKNGKALFGQVYSPSISRKLWSEALRRVNES